MLLAPALVLGAGRRFALDFVPFVLLIVLYEECRGIAHILTRPVRLPQLDAEKFLFFGHVPSKVLQDWLWTGTLQWYDQAMSALTRIHFIVPPTLAFALWLKRRALFYRFAATLLTLSYAGALTFALFPAAPPWRAAEWESPDPAWPARPGGRPRSPRCRPTRARSTTWWTATRMPPSRRCTAATRSCSSCSWPRWCGGRGGAGRSLGSSTRWCSRSPWCIRAVTTWSTS